MERESFIRYKSFNEWLESLPPENQLNVFRSIVNYWIYGIEPEKSKDPLAYWFFRLIKPQIDANNKRFVISQRWWAPIWNQNARKNRNGVINWEKQSKQPTVDLSKQQKQPNVNVNDNVNVNANGNVNENENVKQKKHNNKEEEEELKKNKKIHKRIEYSDLFEEFRKVYPKKKSKQQARTAWNNAIKWWNDPTLIIKKAWEYATEIKLKRVEDKYIKFAQWRLNDWRYDDDYFTGNNWIKPNLDDLY